MITYPLSLPSTNVRATRFRPFTVVGESRSPFTLQSQVQVYAGQLWAVDVVLPPLQRAAAEEWIATLLALNGKQGTFLLGDVAGKAPRGTASGTPVVDGAGQSGLTLSTTGWTASAAGVLLRGDWIQLGDEASSPVRPRRIYRVVADVNADVNGDAVIDIWPRLRESPLDAETLVLNDTKGRFAMKSNEMLWDIDEAIIYGIEFTAVEAVRS